MNAMIATRSAETRKKVMDLLSEGKNRKEVARILNLPVTTIAVIHMAEGKKSGAIKIKPRRQISDLLAKGWKQMRIAKRFKVSNSRISRIASLVDERPRRAAPRASGGIAEAIKGQFLDRLADCYTISEIKSAVNDFVTFLD